MTKAKLRPVKLWQPDIAWEESDDGTILVRQTAPLGDYPTRSRTDWIIGRMSRRTVFGWWNGASVRRSGPG